METLTDKRRTYTFYVDDAVLDVFGPRIGAYGIAVYALLSRHAKQKQSFPSYKHIMKQLNISRMTVVRTLAVLEKAGLVTIETRTSHVGDYDTKLYTLCDLSSFRVGGISQIPPGIPEVPPDTSQIPPDTSQIPGVVSQGDQGGISGRPEGISFKESQGKGNPLCPPSSDIPPLKKKQKGKAPAPAYSPGFVAFWDAYPHERYAQKPTCYKLWLKHDLESRASEIVEKVERLKVTRWADLSPNYIPLTSTWINSGDFDTELIPMPHPVTGNGRLNEKERRTAEATQRILEEATHGRPRHAGVLRRIE